MRLWVVLLGVAAYGCAHDPSVEYGGRAAWSLDNGVLRVTMLAGGGHLAEIRLTGGEEESLNPLWQPPWATIEPESYEREAHRDVYGAGASSRTLAGAVGHTLAVDYWGRPSDAEFAAGMSAHGEAAFRTWELDSAAKTRITASVEMPEAGLRVRRSIRLRPDQSVLHLEETVENLRARDRRIDWVEQVLMGGAFVRREHSRFDAAAAVGEFLAGEVEGFQPTAWADSGDNQRLDFRVFSPGAAAGRNAHYRMNAERENVYATALNREHRLLLGYVFRAEEFPWMTVEEENHGKRELPWKGRGMYRMLAFGTTRPGGAGRRREDPHGDTADGVWVQAREAVTRRYMAFLTPVPTGFAQVADVRLDGREVVVTGSEGAEVRLAYDPLHYDLADLAESAE